MNNLFYVVASCHSCYITCCHFLAFVDLCLGLLKYILIGRVPRNFHHYILSADQPHLHRIALTIIEMGREVAGTISHMHMCVLETLLRIIFINMISTISIS